MPDAPDLARWLQAQVAEEEAVLRGPVPTTRVGHRPSCIYEGGHEGTLFCDCGAVERRLDECEAKRRIIALREHILDAPAGWMYDAVLRLLALPYADRPGYREEWRP